MKMAHRFLSGFSLPGVRLGLAITSLLVVFSFINTSPFQTEAVMSSVGSLPRESVAQTKLPTIDGKQLTLAGLRGKVVVLDFFGMHCVHSRDHIKETMSQFGESDYQRGLQIIGIESESSTAEQVRQYIRDQSINYPVAQIDETTFIRFVNSRDLSAPQTLIFGRDGKLLLHTNGYSAKNEATIKATIQKALEAK